MRGNQSNVANREQNVTRWEKLFSSVAANETTICNEKTRALSAKEAMELKCSKKVRNQSNRVIEGIICDKMNKTSLHVQQQMKSQHGKREEPFNLSKL